VTTSQDDPIAKALMAEVRLHLAAGSFVDLVEDVEAIDSLDAAANPALKVKLDQLRRDVQRRAGLRVAMVDDQLPDLSGDSRAADIPVPTERAGHRPVAEPQRRR